MTRAEADRSARWLCALIDLDRATYHRRRKRASEGPSPRGPWPTPVRNRVPTAVIENGLLFSMWGHHKIAWLCRHDVSDASCLRVLREAERVLPAADVGEQRQPAVARRKAFVELPTRRNRP